LSCGSSTGADFPSIGVIEPTGDGDALLHAAEQMAVTEAAIMMASFIWTSTFIFRSSKELT